MMRVRLWFGLAAFLVAPALFAAEDENRVISPRGSASSDAPASAPAATMNSVSLVAGVTLAAVGGWLFWRNRRGTAIGRERRSLTVDETRSLGNRQYLVVASYEGKKFLIGVCPGRIDMLSPLDGATAAPVKARE